MLVPGLGTIDQTPSHCGHTALLSLRVAYRIGFIQLFGQSASDEAQCAVWITAMEASSQCRDTGIRNYYVVAIKQIHLEISQPLKRLVSLDHGSCCETGDQVHSQSARCRIAKFQQISYDRGHNGNGNGNVENTDTISDAWTPSRLFTDVEKITGTETLLEKLNWFMGEIDYVRNTTFDISNFGALGDVESKDIGVKLRGDDVSQEHGKRSGKVEEWKKKWSSFYKDFFDFHNL
ncbi:hypothetical protein EDD18DRAFT_1112148 [Armillaria luteobubalina]|uniref:Uncharacterized protein n=1 Tax=Armillaria luteobubalina TaxID=153913 RepID=A0AA39PH26_9AGAR|nr:hypothetical protein EDD18DRAFT_1112148 [Armillaria luteobubalina]